MSKATLVQDLVVTDLVLTIESGAAKSTSFYTLNEQGHNDGFRLGNIRHEDASWTAADLVFEVANRADEADANWIICRDDAGAPIVLEDLGTGAFARGFPAALAAWGMWPHMRVRSVADGTTTSANQGGDRTLKVKLGG